MPKSNSHTTKKLLKNVSGRLGLYIFMLLTWIDKLFDVTKLYKLEIYGIKLRPKDVKEKLMKLNGCESISKLTSIPSLIIIGDNDPIVGVDEAQAVFEAANEPKELVIIKSANHIYKGKEDELIGKTIEWAKAVLGKT